MLALVVSIFFGWLMLKMLWPRAPIYIEPPPPQVVIHMQASVEGAPAIRPGTSF
jgi:hypothetical protein